MKYIVCLSIIVFIYSNASFSQDSVKIINESSGFWERQYLTGNWNGVRSSIQEFGINIDFVYKGELWLNPKDDSKKSYYCDNFDLLLNFDLEKIFGLNGLNVFFHGLGNHGNNVAEPIGIKQGITNIAAYNTSKVFELYIEQFLFNNRISLLFGLLDLNSQFDVKNVGQLFINPSHGIGPDWSQTGVNGPSIFPTSSLAFRFRWIFDKNSYFQFGVFDGVSGNPDNPVGTQIILNENDGLLLAAKVGFIRGPKTTGITGIEAENKTFYNKLGLGVWYYTDKYSHFFSHIGNWGAYLIIEQDLYQERDDELQGLTLSTRLGITDDSLNQFEGFLGAALVYTGLIPGRDNDKLGIALATGKNSMLFRNERLINSLPAEKYETDIELTYRLQLSPCIGIQPNFQYVINPSLSEKKENVYVFGTRVQLNF